MMECGCNTGVGTRKVVRGNDFSVSVRVTRLVMRDGLSQREDIGLASCTGVKASVVSRTGRRTALGCAVKDGRLVADFDETVPAGVYGLEVTGKDAAGADWRAYLKPGEFVQIVEATSEAFTPYGDQPEIVMTTAPSTVSTETIGKIDEAIKTASEADAAVKGKADKATTLAGYGITDAYTKDETDSLLAGKADSSAMQSALGNKADKAATLAGYGITDAYTKGETYSKEETLSKAEIEELENAAVESFALKTAIPKNVSELANDAGYLTEHQDISGKADRGTKLAEYGITDAYTKTEADALLAGKVDTTDSRLSDARPASDVQAWAKAAAKPSYTKEEIGLGNVDNTSDADKPVSTATQAALDLKVDKADAVAYYETIKEL